MKAPKMDGPFNIAAEINDPDPQAPLREFDYNCTTDERLASRRPHECRTQEEFSASYIADLPLSAGLSCREAMAGQCENDQFPYTTDAYGKQRT